MSQPTTVPAPSAESVVSQILDVAETIASALPVGGEIASAIKLAAVIGNGIAHASPAILALYDTIKASVEGGAAPTPEAWDAYDAAADTAHVEWLAAVAEARGTSTT